MSRVFSGAAFDGLKLAPVKLREIVEIENHALVVALLVNYVSLVN